MASKVRSIQRARDKHVAEVASGEVSVTYAQLIGANTGGALGALLSHRFPGRLMQLVRLGSAITAELTLFEEAKKKLIEQYGGKLDEARNTWTFGAKQAQAEREFKELLETKVSIKAPRFSEAEMEGSTLTSVQVLQLIWLVEE